MTRRFIITLVSTALCVLPTHAANNNNDPYSDYSDGYIGAYDDEAYSGGYESLPYTEKTAKQGYLVRTTLDILGSMDAKEHRGNLQAFHWLTDLTVLRNTYGDWTLSLTPALRISHFGGSAARALDIDNLYTIWLNMNATWGITQKTRLVFGVTPQISTDFDTWTSDNLFFGAYALLAGPLNNKFSYGIGIGYYPQLGSSPLLPVLQFNWQVNNAWALQLEGLRLSYINRVNDKFQWGPFIGVVSGTWTIHHHRRVRRFVWTSGVAGLGAETGLGKWGNVSPRLLTDLGFSFGNSATFKTSNGEHELSKHHYEPGFYCRLGLQLEW